jgi:putative lipoprotein
VNELLLSLLLFTTSIDVSYAAPACVGGLTPTPDIPAAAGIRRRAPWHSTELRHATPHTPFADLTGDLREEDPWLGSDKFRHFLLSYAVTAFTFASLRSGGLRGDDALAGGMAAAAVAGLGKEVYDRRSGGLFSGRDLVADGVGVMTAYFLLREVR